MPGDDTGRTDRLERLRAAIEAVQSGGGEPLVDELAEERLAPLTAKANRLIEQRDRSVAELRRRLTDSLDEGDDPALVEAVIDRCLRAGMLDDARFAHEWVRQRAANQRKSVAVLRRELREKGVAAPVIEEALEQVSEADQDRVLGELVTKKAGTVKTVPADRRDYDRALRRIVGVAARRGFPQGRSLTAARQALDARIAELGGER
ncbi:regulatory protein RecX [Corynebacterium nuruki]|uniref:regulatory protein RecX n=1 Tax=Corynebacterium nuruki TaxID=1032851 RepID=UPI000248576A|nr:regulatory protein RecX [Corynebacterium nuruki]